MFRNKLAVFGMVAVMVIVLASIGVIHIDPQTVASYMTYILVGIAVVYFTYIFLAGGLNADGVATAQGGREWYASTVRAVLRSSGGAG